MMTDEPLEPIDGDPDTAKREEAFMAAPFHWKDIELKPLSIGREGDWLSHLSRIGLPPLHQAINSAEAFLAHAVRLLFFLANEPRVWLSVWMKGGAAAPILLEALISNWTEKHIGPGDQVELIKTALEIYDRSRATQPKLIDDDEEDGEGNECGPAREPNTSPSCASPSMAPHPLSSSSTNSAKKRDGRLSTSTAARKAGSTSGRKKVRKKKRRSGRASQIGVITPRK